MRGKMAFDILKFLYEDGYVVEGKDNLVHAEKAFFAARIIDWIRHKAETETDFDLTSYLTILMYYKTGMADLKFSENGDKILYQMNNNDKEVQELVDSLIKSTSQSRQDSPSTGESDSASTESTDRDPEP
jgi:hypothetical protein